MTAIGTVSLDRSLLSLPALVIDTAGFSTYTVDRGGLGRVGRTPRETIATSSPFMHGLTRTSIVWDEATYPLTVRVQAASSSALDTALVTLDDALSQFTYPLTEVLNGVTKVWSAWGAPTYNSVDGLTAFERVMAFYEDLAITIPVYPVAS